MLVRDTASGVTESQDSIMSATQSANKLYLGPVSGASALATFRSLVSADLPGGGGAASAYFPMFWGFKAVNGGGGLTTTSTCLTAMNNIDNTGTTSSQSATATKALRMRCLSSASAGNSAGFCERAAAGTGLAGGPCIRTLGTTAVLLANITLQQTTNMRIWFGLTEQSANAMAPAAITLSAAANASGGTTVYTAAGLTAGQLVGQYFTVAGFTTGANNGGPWLCSANTTTTITLANASGVSETHAGTATYGVAINFRSDTPSAAFVGFRYSTAAGDTKYHLVCQTDSGHQTVQAESGSHTVNTTNELQLAFIYNTSLSRVDFYIGLDYVGSISTNLPSTSLVMQPFVVIDNVGTANAQSFEMSQMRGQ